MINFQKSDVVLTKGKLCMANFLNNSQKYLDSHLLVGEEEAESKNEVQTNFKKSNNSFYFDSPLSQLQNRCEEFVLNSPKPELNKDFKLEVKKPSYFFEMTMRNNLESVNKKLGKFGLNFIDSPVSAKNKKIDFKNLNLSKGHEKSDKNAMGEKMIISEKRGKKELEKIDTFQTKKTPFGDSVKSEGEELQNIDNFKMEGNNNNNSMEEKLLTSEKRVAEEFDMECVDHLVKLKQFKKLAIVLTEIFKGEKVDLISKNLCLWEVKLISKIMEKKYQHKYFRNILEKCSPENLKNSILKLQEIISFGQIGVSKKRIEENNKFVYKNSLKILKKFFYDIRNLPRSKSSESLFYKYYFREIALKKNISLEQFIDPLNLKQRHKRTLNNKFFSLIFSSPNFKNDFEKIMNDHLLKFYQKLILRKFVKFFIKFDNKFNSSLEINTITENILDYLTYNKRVKFPWDKYEIKNAMSKFLKKIDFLVPSS